MADKQKRTIRSNRPDWRLEDIDEKQKDKAKRKRKKKWVQTGGVQKLRKKK